MVYCIANSTNDQTSAHSLTFTLLMFDHIWSTVHACVWDPYLVKDVDLLESVQKFALKVCCKQWSSSYQDLLELSKLSSLQTRREAARLAYMYKLVHNHIDFPDAPIQHRPPPPYSSRNRNPLALELHHCHTSKFLNSFFPRTSTHWNSLPADTVTSTSLV